MNFAIKYLKHLINNFYSFFFISNNSICLSSTMFSFFHLQLYNYIIYFMPFFICFFNSFFWDNNFSFIKTRNEICLSSYLLLSFIIISSTFLLIVFVTVTITVSFSSLLILLYPLFALVLDIFILYKSIIWALKFSKENLLIIINLICLLLLYILFVNNFQNPQFFHSLHQ